MNPSIFFNPSGLIVLDLPNLDHLNIESNAGLASVFFPHLVSVRWEARFLDNPDLFAINMPILVEAGVIARFSFRVENCTALENVSFPNWVATNRRANRFTNCALTEASVDHVLARCVASPAYVFGSIDLSGGTSATPGTQGQIDKAALIARGLNVVTN